MESPIDLNVSALPPSGRHQAIFRVFENMDEGQDLILTVDHDPKPLFYELNTRYPKSFDWSYLHEGPDFWKVAIRRHMLFNKRNVGDLVLEDLALGKLFEEFGIDFCCHGNVTLEEACRRKSLNINELLQAIRKKGGSDASWHPHFDHWSVGLLIRFILENHHVREKEALEEISELAENVAEHHGEQFPNLKKVRQLVEHLKYAALQHFRKEEEELFPMILQGSKSVELLKGLERMKAEHVEVGVLLSDITLLTSNFRAPAGACSSFRFLYHKLSELKQDLVQHIHLENNVLVRKAAG